MKTTILTTALVLLLGLVGNASADLVAHYEFEGNANDTSGNSLNGTAYGGPGYVGGIFGQAISLDGVNDYVDCGNSPVFDITSQITLAAWVKTNDSGNSEHNPYITKGDHSFALKHGFNGIQFFIYDGNYRSVHFPVDSSFNDTWHHLAGTYDGSEVKLYIDGTLEAALAHTSFIASSAHSVNIASNAEVSDRFYEGAIDDVRIYDNALTEAQVLQLYQWRPTEDVKGFTYQGRLLDNNIVADGLYDIEFRLFDAVETGTQLKNTIAVHDIDVIDGYFTVALDFGNDIFDGDDRWLEIRVRPGDSIGSFTTLSPRQKIMPTPYAIYAETAGSALSGPGGGGTDSDWTISGSDIYRLTGNVGIGTSSPSAKLEINGQVKITGGSPGAGKVLTSDAAGLASWQTPTGGSGPDGDWAVSGNNMYAMPSGNVGVGISNPTSKLDVNGQMRIRGGLPGDGKVLTSDAAGLASWQTPTGGGGPDGDWMVSGNNMYTIPSGNVGIGTTSPNRKLVVTGSSDASIIATENVGGNGGGVSALALNGNAVFGQGLIGVFGTTVADAGAGVRGGATSGYGVHGTSSSGYAGYFEGPKNYFEGNVGIGTTSPGSKLDVKGGSGSNAISASSTAGGGYAAISGTTSTANTYGVWGSSSDYVGGHFESSGGTALEASTSSGYAATFMGGNVGIGTTSPSHKLQVTGSSFITILSENSAKDGVAVWAEATGGGYSRGVFAIGSPDGEGVYGQGGFAGVYGQGDNYGVLGMSVSGVGVEGRGIGTSGTNYGIYGRTSSSSGYAGYFEGRGYFSKEVNIDTSGVAALRVNGAEAIWYDGTEFSWGFGGIWNYFSDGVCIGGPPADPSPHKLVVNGSAAKSTGTTWSVFSDARLKEVQGDYRGGLFEVSQLNPVRYSYKEGNALELPTEKEHIGLVAQDVQDVIPEAVEENSDGYLMLNSDPIIWSMVNAIKDLDAQNQQLKAQNMELMQRLEALETIMHQHQFAVVKEVQK